MLIGTLHKSPMRSLRLSLNSFFPWLFEQKNSESGFSIKPMENRWLMLLCDPLIEIDVLMDLCKVFIVRVSVDDREFVGV